MEEATTHNAPDAEYRVGYEHPPKESQFQKGKSGNPRGRPPKPKSTLKARFAERLDELVPVPGKKRTRISRCQAMIRNLVEKAAAGEFKALMAIIRMMDLEDGDASPTVRDWIVVSYVESFAFQSSEETSEAFYQQQEKNKARWTRELREGAGSIKGMIERELSRKITVGGGKPRKVAITEVIVARFMKEASENPSVLRLLFKLVPKKKFRSVEDEDRIEIRRPTEEELEHWPAPGMTREEWKERSEQNVN
jgi:hypothetical protein